jgi:hypothetical protein
MQSTNPSVTYNYRTDQELLKANQNATTYCGQYQITPRTAGLMNNPDGSKIVVFECERTALYVGAGHPNRSYTYRTDQELVQASQTADAYCLKYGRTNPVGARDDASSSLTGRAAPRSRVRPYWEIFLSSAYS